MKPRHRLHFSRSIGKAFAEHEASDAGLPGSMAPVFGYALPYRRYGKARHGKAWQGKAWQGMARHGKAWQGMARHSKAWQGMAKATIFSVAKQQGGGSSPESSRRSGPRGRRVEEVSFEW
jgi:hypothetical protein